MPKITWEAPNDEILTADDIDEAEGGFAEYTGDLPPGGVYRFKLRFMRQKTASSGKQSYNLLLNLDGSWKPNHAKFDGCPMWDDVYMTKASAGFAKQFAAALGVTGAALISGAVSDSNGNVTKIGNKKITEGMLLYIAVRRDEYNGEPRIIRAGGGYQVVESATVEAAEPAEAEAKPAKAKAAKTAKAKKSKADDDEPPF